jgi:DNA polymerase-4
MAMAMARRLCPEAVVLRGDHALYQKYSQMVAEIVEARVPLYERASVDEFYLDMTGMDRFFGTLRWARALRREIIRETGLPLSFGLSVNKTVSKIATGEAKPAGELTVPPERVHPFLDPLPVRRIPMVGGKSYRLLRSMGVERIATLRAIPPELLQQLFGKNGLLLWKKANGLDDSPVVNERLRKSIGTERTFDRDSDDAVFLLATLVKMTEQSAYELRRRGRVASRVTVKIRYSDFETHTLQQQIPLTAFDHTLIATAKALFRRLYTRRVRVRLLGVRLGGLVPGTQQLGLFGNDHKMARLYQAMDRIREKYGTKAVGRMIE